MNKIWVIAQREFLETVKTKTFIFSLVATPALIVLILFITKQAGNIRTEAQPPKKIAVTNLADDLTADLEQAFDQYNERHPHRRIFLELLPAADRSDLEAQIKRMEEAVRRGQYAGYLLIAADVVEGGDSSKFYQKARNLADFEFADSINRLVNDAVVNKRYRRHDLSPQLIAQLRRGVSLEKVNVMAEGGKGGEPIVTVMAPFFFLFLMFAGIFGTNQQMLTSVVEEKNSRVMEILLSSVSAFQLMAGKILGLVCVGFLLVFFWGGGAYAAAVYRGMGQLAGPLILVCFAVYFVLGFVLYSSILVAIGSVCNTVKEAQSLMAPITMLIVLPMVAWFYVATHPNGTAALVLSFVPPITPMIMMLRIAAAPDLPLLQILATMAVLAASVPAAMWASAKIFRTGVLMYGKPPSIRELLRWVRSG